MKRDFEHRFKVLINYNVPRSFLNSQEIKKEESKVPKDGFISAYCTEKNSNVIE